MMTNERIEAVLNRVRPFLHADSRNIELVDLRGNSAVVKLTGLCAGCPSAESSVTTGRGKRVVRETRRLQSGKPRRSMTICRQ
jgi:Fe-S cluster biogenesis protein NfuA